MSGEADFDPALYGDQPMQFVGQKQQSFGQDPYGQQQFNQQQYGGHQQQPSDFIVPNNNPGGEEKDTDAKVELKKLWCGIAVAHPAGCIIVFICVLVIIGISANGLFPVTYFILNFC